MSLLLLLWVFAGAPTGPDTVPTHGVLVERLADGVYAVIRREPPRVDQRIEQSPDHRRVSRAFAGESQLLKILFSYYVATPAVQRAYELN